MPPAMNLLFVVLFQTAIMTLAIIYRNYYWSKDKGPLPKEMAVLWTIAIPIFLGQFGYAYFVKDPLYRYIASPIVITLPDGTLATGHWWIDGAGGHTEISGETFVCTEDYDATTNRIFVRTSASCAAAKDAEIWVERFGANFKDRGEGVYRQGQDYGWYVFGWKARLAIWSGGWIGLPNHTATKQDFEALEKRALRG